MSPFLILYYFIVLQKIYNNSEITASQKYHQQNNHATADCNNETHNYNVTSSLSKTPPRPSKNDSDRRIRYVQLKNVLSSDKIHHHYAISKYEKHQTPTSAITYPATTKSTTQNCRGDKQFFAKQNKCTIYKFMKDLLKRKLTNKRRAAEADEEPRYIEVIICIKQVYLNRFSRSERFVKACYITGRYIVFNIHLPYVAVRAYCSGYEVSDLPIFNRISILHDGAFSVFAYSCRIEGIQDIQNISFGWRYSGVEGFSLTRSTSDKLFNGILIHIKAEIKLLWKYKSLVILCIV